MDPPLPLDDFRRYGRQMILNGFGLPAQLKLQQASVIVVGAGGLGCPALQYLAAGGVGRLGIVDHDDVELSNLQRQILHTEARIGWNKARSAKHALHEMNPKTRIDVYDTFLEPSNALSILSSYDLILDCTDNAPTRYLLSDSAVALGKPLVSGAAMKLDGQLCTYNLGVDGPCYRCLYPKPPAIEMMGTCEESGVLGVVTGIIGNLQALEAIKIITGTHDGKPSLLIFSAMAMPPFRSIKLRSRKPTCPACGQEGEKIGQIEEMDYVAFCGGKLPERETTGLVRGEYRIMAKELQEVIAKDPSVRLIDVRPPVEFGICSLPSSINVPLAEIVSDPNQFLSPHPTYFICRLGNDSQIAADAVRNAIGGKVVGQTNGTNAVGSTTTTGTPVSVINEVASGPYRDLVGGLRAWSRVVDPSFPEY